MLSQLACFFACEGNYELYATDPEAYEVWFDEYGEEYYRQQFGGCVDVVCIVISIPAAIGFIAYIISRRHDSNS